MVLSRKQVCKERKVAMKKGLYENINKRKKAGTSRPKSKSTIDSKIYKQMKSKKGGFSDKKK
jgi:hypothetical protein